MPLTFSSEIIRFLKLSVALVFVLILCFFPHFLEAQSPINDSPCYAKLITVGSTTAFDNTFATTDVDEVSPGAGSNPNSCGSQSGWCFFDKDPQATLYFRFEAPISGCVSILADGFDTQLALWEAGHCNDYVSFSEIAANDDSGYQLGGSIQSAGLVQTSCLTPGKEYLIQLDGHSGATGLGTITLTDCGNAPLELNISDCQTIYTGYTGYSSDTAYIRAYPQGGFPPYTITWANDPSIVYENSDSMGIAVAPTQSTAYTLTVTDANGCSVSAMTLVEVEDVSTCLLSNGSLSSTPRSGSARNGIRICNGTTEKCVPSTHVQNYLNQGYRLGSCANTCTAQVPAFPPPPTCVNMTLSITGDFFSNFDNSWTLTDLTTNQLVDSRPSVIGAPQSFMYCLDPSHCYAFTLNDNTGDGFSWGGNYTISFNGQTTSSSFLPAASSTLFSETANLGTCASRSAKTAPALELEANAFPNPFSDQTTLQFGSPEDATVTVQILTLTGQVIANLFQDEVLAHQSQSVHLSAEGLANGMYLYRITSDKGLKHTGKLLLQK